MRPSLSVRLAAGLLVALLTTTPFGVPSAAAASKGVAAPDPGYGWVGSGSQTQDENFYLLTLLTRVPEYREALAKSPSLAGIKEARSQRVSAILAACGAEDAKCRIEAMLWQPDEISAAGEAIAADPVIARIAARHLRPSGAFARYASKSDGDLIRSAWFDAAAAMNRIYRVYGLAEPPRYPEIDAGDFKLDAGFGRLIAETLDMVTLSSSKDAPFFDAPLQFALTLLYLNERELVRRSSPLEASENLAAASKVRRTKWSKYPYPAILVLGNGPNTLGKSIGNFGKLRIMRAAQLYREGTAPFIIVSGGAVHPAHTDTIEAVVMKRELIERYGVPASAVLIDPAARHTTTNFRNAARLMFRYGLPMDRPSIVTSSRVHITYVAGDVFRQRFDTELGYQPIERGRQIGPYEMEFRPLSIAMDRDAMDPLDP